MKKQPGFLPMGQTENANTFVYFYQDAPYLEVRFPEGKEVFPKRGSDVCIQTDPPIWQLLYSVKEATTATVTMYPGDGLPMRPRRAAEDEAILSQQGKMLPYGVNGLYDREIDQLISWYCVEWQYQSDRIHQDELGERVKISVTVTPKAPLCINIQPNYYQRHLGYKYHLAEDSRRPDLRTICGWCSWEAYHNRITQQDIKQTAAFLAENFKAHGLSYMQIDDGYQNLLMPEDGQSLQDFWLTGNEKFPEGHPGIVKAITEQGFTAGIWTNAVVNNPKYAKESGLCILDEKGEPTDQDWIHYTFDCLETSIQKEILPAYQRLKEAGYRYFKVDALRHLIHDGLMKAAQDGLISEQDADAGMRRYVKAVREAIGEENYLLSCWGVLDQMMGVCDGMRFATDANASEHSFYMFTSEAARWHHTHGVLYLNDPDHLCIRSESGVASTIASLTSLNGYLYMISDEVSLYDEEKCKLIKATIPPVSSVATAETGPLELSTGMNYYAAMGDAHESTSAYPAGSLWATHFVLGCRRWTVMNLINNNPAAEEGLRQIPLEKLALNPKIYYVAFDFFAQRPLGVVTGQLEVMLPKLKHNTVVALTQLNEEIEFVASSRHVSCDAVSITNLQFTDDTLSLEIAGIPGTEEDYWFYLSKEDTLKIVSEGGKVVSSKQNDHFLNVRFAHEEKLCQLKLML